MPQSGKAAERMVLPSCVLSLQERAPQTGASEARGTPDEVATVVEAPHGDMR